MEVTELQEYLSTYQQELVREILAENYLPDAIRGVEIPKTNEERPVSRNFNRGKVGSEPAANLQGGLGAS